MYSRAKVFGTVVGACTSIYIVDDIYWYQVIQRSLRAFGLAGFTIVNYKFFWTPETASEINLRVARAVTDCCLENEGLYVKIGQAICSMAAVLPPEYTESLSRLLDRAKTYEFEIIEKIIREELGEGVIIDLDPNPVGSASLAQVHKGVYASTGEVVAVKVQKPNVSVQAKYDLAMYRFLVRMLEWTFEIPLSWSVGFTCDHFMDELDFRLEAKNSELTRSQLETKFHNILYVPKIIASTQKVLIAEWIPDTVMISDVKGLKERGFNSKAVVLDATRIFGHQIFHTGHIHCDPHPGNLLVRKGPTGLHQIVLIDHGLYVDLPEKLRKEYAALWVAMSPPANKKVVEEICASWGIGSIELFQTIVRAASSGGKRDPALENIHLAAKEANRKNNARGMNNIVKENLKKLLQDTSKFPKELILVGRCMNYIRAANWTHGAPIDRVAVLAESAREANQLETGSQRGWLVRIGSGILSYIPGGSPYQQEVKVG